MDPLEHHHTYSQDVFFKEELPGGDQAKDSIQTYQVQHRVILEVKINNMELIFR